MSSKLSILKPNLAISVKENYMWKLLLKRGNFTLIRKLTFVIFLILPCDLEQDIFGFISVGNCSSLLAGLHITRLQVLSSEISLGSKVGLIDFFFI
jgi:hypothetical protein